MSSTAIESPVLTIIPIRTVMGVRFYPQFDGKNFTTASPTSPKIRSIISFGTEAEAESFLASENKAFI